MSQNQLVDHSFRPDVEGLRGIAVLFVVLFHFDLLGLTSGFIGVDIFFVISGYLMTKIMTDHSFEWSVNSIKNYYNKRFWRIAPAYYVALLLTVSTFFLFPWGIHLEQFRLSLLAASLMSYNIHAPSDTGYFGISALENPLLHLWSLGVEIQFYLIWPLVIFFTRNSAVKRTIIVLCGVILVSFISSLILAVKDPEVAYFSILTRLWQFGFGAIALLLVQKKLSEKFAIPFTWCALAILIFFAFLAPEEGWPGFLAVFPTAAAAYLLWVGAHIRTTPLMLLETTPLRFFGKISYSLYLIHWPIAVFLYLLVDDFETKTYLRFCGLIISLLISYFLFKYIETKFLIKKKTSKKHFVFTSEFPWGYFLQLSSLFLAITAYLASLFPNKFCKQLSKIKQ